MEELQQRVAQLEAEVKTLKTAASTAVLMATSATSLAYSLAATHPTPTDLMAVFKALSSSLEGHVTYSLVSDEQLAAHNRRSEEVIAFLQNLIDAQTPPPVTP